MSKYKVTLTVRLTVDMDAGSGPNAAQAVWNDFCESLRAAHIYSSDDPLCRVKLKLIESTSKSLEEDTDV